MRELLRGVVPRRRHGQHWRGADGRRAIFLDQLLGGNEYWAICDNLQEPLETAFVYAEQPRKTDELPHEQPKWAHAEHMGAGRRWAYHLSPHTTVTAVEPPSDAQHLRTGRCGRHCSSRWCVGGVVVRIDPPYCDVAWAWHANRTEQDGGPLKECTADMVVVPIDDAALSGAIDGVLRDERVAQHATLADANRLRVAPPAVQWAVVLAHRSGVGVKAMQDLQRLLRAAAAAAPAASATPKPAEYTARGVAGCDALRFAGVAVGKSVGVAPIGAPPGELLAATVTAKDDDAVTVRWRDAPAGMAPEQRIPRSLWDVGCAFVALSRERGRRGRDLCC